MRPLLAALSLVARWADAPCGCAAHNGWAAVAAGHDDHDHGHGHDEAPALRHDCGGTGRPAFAGTAPVHAPAPTTAVALAAEPPTVPSVDPSDVSLLSSPPLRAALNVYRV